MPIPCIVKDPVSTARKVGDKAEFSVTAAGLGLKYRWQYWNASAGKWSNITASSIDGKSSKKMTVPVTDARNGREFRCAVSNAAGEVYSKAAVLTVAK